MTHQTPVDYLNRQRIEEACLQLAATDDSITEIAYRNGFNDLSYFIRTFKKYKGMTPGNISEDKSVHRKKTRTALFKTVLIFLILLRNCLVPSTADCQIVIIHLTIFHLTQTDHTLPDYGLLLLYRR